MQTSLLQVSQNEFSAILKNRLSLSFGSRIFSITFASLELVKIEDGVVAFSISTQQIKDKINLVHHEKFKRVVRATCSEILLVTLKQIVISVRDLGLPSSLKSGMAVGANKDFKSNFTPLSLIPDVSRYGFDSFITSPENLVAYSTCLEFSSLIEKHISQNIGQNILFINGSVGNGKTHLMNSIAINVAKKTHKKITYLTADRFMFKYIQSIRENTLFDFKEKLLSSDVLLIDDIHFIIGKKASSEELINAISIALAEGKFVVCSSVHQPSALCVKSEDETAKKIVSVLNAGLSCRIVNPSTELRRNIIQSKANSISLVLTPNVIEYLVLNITSNVRDIESVLSKISFNAKFLNKAIDIAFVKALVGEFLSITAKTITPNDVILATAKIFNIEAKDITSDEKKDKQLTAIKQVAICLVKDMTSLSYNEIASLFGKKTPSCVTASLVAMDKFKKDPQMFLKISQVVSILKDENYFD